MPGTTHSLSVVADGESISYQWFRDGVALTGETGSTLSLTPLRGTNSAVSPGYVVVVTGAFNSTSNAPATVTVGPDITVGLLGTNTVAPTDLRSFGITVTGTDPITYSWTKDAVPLTEMVISSIPALLP